MTIEHQVLTGLAPVLLKAGFTAKQGAAVAASIATLVETAGEKQREDLEETLALLTDGMNALKEQAKLNRVRDEIVGSLVDQVDDLERSVEELKKRLP